jgi:hypothetical protein
MNDGSRGAAKMTAGLDLGDKYSYFFVLDNDSGEVVEEGRLRTTPPTTSAVASTPQSG